MAERRSDILENIGERGLTIGGGGLLALGFAALLFYYRGDGYLIGLAYILLLVGIGALAYTVYLATRVRQIDSIEVECVYCHVQNSFTAFPENDFRCSSCNRLVPVQDGVILDVHQVRCGYCNTLNYYSDKNEVLICEECDHEIPLATASGEVKHVMRAYAVTDDDRQYELVLTSVGNKQEDLISALQQILALNRNQVKNMLAELPVVVLQGITRKKAEMLQAQLAIHDASAEMRAIE